MKTSLRYKIVLWMVWVQLALLPVIIYMNRLEVYPEVWRWNISNWIPITGYVIGLLVLPMSRNLAISPILRACLKTIVNRSEFSERNNNSCDHEHFVG